MLQGEQVGLHGPGATQEWHMHSIWPQFATTNHAMINMTASYQSCTRVR